MDTTPEKLLSERKRTQEVKQLLGRALLHITEKQPDFTGIAVIKLSYVKGELRTGIMKESEKALKWDGLSKFGNGKL